ncbi:2-phospho-L-lactate guanylyltransferase [Crenalkalicoccus roseus]|uniref:2-phospho-L-lactate guanylyltransferase n=1 Tax=Crenalkalicoccus roseus TaxID=1485588 RepID=UPI001080B107|nr:2-phospho-L-lactate guanylyltransferase [Crenalkalicoccus roseus]
MSRDLWAVLPVKELDGAKQRLSPLLAPPRRRALAEVMLTEVLEALAATRGLAGILVVTLDPWAAAQARRIGARIVAEGAREGHTGSVAAALRLLAREGRSGAMAVPGDIPAATAAEFEAVLAAHGGAPAFTIAAAHDEMGSNAVACSPPDVVPLRFGDNSFFPHLEAARRRGIAPCVLRLPGIGLDIDHPADLAAFLRLPQSAGTRTRAWLEANGVAAALAEQGLG